MLGCICVTLTHNVHSGLRSFGPTAVCAGDLVLSVICPLGLLNEQCAGPALRLHDHPLFVDFGLIFAPLHLRLGPAGHHSRKPQRLARLDDDTVLHRDVKVHRGRF